MKSFIWMVVVPMAIALTFVGILGAAVFLGWID